MQVDGLAIRLRARTSMEASDVGVRLCQSAARSVFPCCAVAAVPVVVLAILSYDVATWLPTFVIWWAKPWLDQTILFVLSRAAFGQSTTIRDLWRARRQVWWRQLFFTLTIRRLSLWRALTQPVYSLEGLSIGDARPRVRQIRRGMVGSALLVAHAFSMTENILGIALVSLAFWLVPEGATTPAIRELLSGQVSGFSALLMPCSYALAALFVEPFYVGSGFAMYLNRRVQLEAWDIEQEFRRVFAA